MLLAVITARIVVAAAFTFAAVAKLRDRPATAAAVAGLGVPGGAAGTTANVLPAVELVAALLVAVPRTATVGAAVAAVLLCTFSAGVATALRHGRRPVCACFGAFSRRAIGPDTLVRNGALLALAVIAGLPA